MPSSSNWDSWMSSKQRMLSLTNNTSVIDFKRFTHVGDIAIALINLYISFVRFSIIKVTYI
jgi:hypothetical protein